MKPICKGGDEVYGATIADKVILLPCVVPQSPDQLKQIIMTAVAATIAYRKRVSQEMPVWVNEFAFSRERALQAELQAAQQLAVKLEGKLDQYAAWKGLLCFQSDPLVSITVKMLDHFFGIRLTVDEKFVEDATLRDDHDAALAVFEVKGVKRSFTRNDVNQVDSHRERLGLVATTPGVLIMNTMMGADSLKGKMERPHPDIIKKAVADNVLLVRTLDLLRLADRAEKGDFKADDLRTILLSQAGWLRVEADSVEIVKT